MAIYRFPISIHITIYAQIYLLCVCTSIEKAFCDQSGKTKRIRIEKNAKRMGKQCRAKGFFLSIPWQRIAQKTFQLCLIKTFLMFCCKIVGASEFSQMLPASLLFAQCSLARSLISLCLSVCAYIYAYMCLYTEKLFWCCKSVLKLNVCLSNIVYTRHTTPHIQHTL